jgi:hypothetical protein
LAGFALSNRPRRRDGGPTAVVLVADRFPAPGDPLADYALTLNGARVEARSRPAVVDRTVARKLTVDYGEDDGVVARVTGLVRLLNRHPIRCVADVWHRPPGSPGLAAIAPAVNRLRRDGDARVRVLGGAGARAAATRLAALAGRDLD